MDGCSFYKNGSALLGGDLDANAHGTDWLTTTDDWHTGSIGISQRNGFLWSSTVSTIGSMLPSEKRGTSNAMRCNLLKFENDIWRLCCLLWIFWLWSERWLILPRTLLPLTANLITAKVEWAGSQVLFANLLPLPRTLLYLLPRRWMGGKDWLDFILWEWKYTDGQLTNRIERAPWCDWKGMGMADGRCENRLGRVRLTNLFGYSTYVYTHCKDYDTHTRTASIKY